MARDSASMVQVDVSIVANENLRDLRGLGNIRAVGRSFILSSCPSVQTLDGLQRLERVGSLFVIEDASNLASLEHVESLTTVGEALHIQGNRMLASLQPMASTLTSCVLPHGRIPRSAAAATPQE